MAGPLAAPVLLYSACTCVLMALTLAPAVPGSVTECFLLVLGSPLNALITFNFIFMVFVIMAQIVSRTVFGTISDEELAIVKECGRNFIMFKSVYVFSALHAAQYTDLIIWMTCFTLFGWLRTFVALAYHRLSHLDYQQQELNDNRKRLILCIAMFLVVDVAFMTLLINVFSTAGWRPLILLVHEGGLTAIACICSIILYGLQVVDNMSSADHSQKAFYLDSAGEIIIQTLSLILLLQVWAAYGLSLTVVDMFFFMIVRAVYVRISSRIVSLVAYRRVLNDINTRFADATAEELQALDDHCAICHEQLQLGLTKKLPCSHFFHLPCLRQWMKYRRTCPVCRSDLLHPDNSGDNHNNDHAGTSRQVPNQWGLRRLFHFHTGNWGSWMPNISFEVVRGVHVAPLARRDVVQPPPVRILSEMFPNVPEEMLQRYLDRAHGVVPLAIEHLVNDNDDLGNTTSAVEREVGSPRHLEIPNNGNSEASGGPGDVSSEPSRDSTNGELSHESAAYSLMENVVSVDNGVIESTEATNSTSETVGEFQSSNQDSSMRRRPARSTSDLDERRMAAVARIEALARGQQPPP